tara:strand:+ start:112 stop:579 length:468 start_codon:yes stop_codon:yes gene_type:complete
MKTNIEKVYSKLPKKVNLKSYKVDLNVLVVGAESALSNVYEHIDVLDDIENKSQDTDRQLTEYRSVIQNFEIQTSISEAKLSNSENDIKDLMSRYEEAAQELGVDPKSIEMYITLEQGLVLIENYLNWATKNIELLKSIIVKLDQISSINSELYN